MRKERRSSPDGEKLFLDDADVLKLHIAIGKDFCLWLFVTSKHDKK